jgi:YVTN family beta-propeller protein
MIKRIGTFFSFILIASGVAIAQLPGTDGGRVLLPNGWWLSPAGTSIDVGDLPLNAALSADQRYLAVTHGGMSQPELMLIDLKEQRVVQKLPLKDSWLGITFHGKTLYVSGGNQNCVYTFDLVHGKLKASRTIPFAPPRIAGYPPKGEFAWAAGLDVDRNYLAVVFRGDSTLRYYNLKSRKIVKVKLDGMPYYCKYLDDGTLLVSMWSSARIEAFRGRHRIYRVATGDHPTEIAVRGRYAFVANANDNSVSVIDLRTRRAVADVSTTIYPDSPEGSTTNSVCVTTNGKYVLAANADNNSVTVIDVSNIRRPVPIGFIPTGWYPTKVMELKDGTVLVLNGKGNRSYANPEHQYIGRLLKGTLSFFKFPDTKKLAEYTKQVYMNTPYRPAASKEATFTPDNPVPNKVGGTSPIKYVFYFIKENRTYDQVFGDIKEGNGDSSLVLFGRKITPNIHALAENYVLLDNLYCDAEVSADGHNWSTAAYATDYVEKSWPPNYAGRGAPYEFEGGQPVASPEAGYIWNLCEKHGVSFKDYGEFVESNPDTNEPNTANEKALIGHIDPMYRSWDLDYSDVSRFETWDRDFTKLIAGDTVPHFNIIRLPNDHTAGTRKGSLTPQAMVAQNDYALGLFVGAISHSKIWSQSAIFVIEDDAQDGADHVDAHRTEALVISPYCKRHFVDSTLYTTSSVLRTMELILGMPPMSQYDGGAEPMFNSFTMNADTSSYNVTQPLIDLNERNKDGAVGQNIIDRMNLNVADAVPERLFNEIIWKAIKGTDMPAPRYSILSGKRGD